MDSSQKQDDTQNLKSFHTVFWTAKSYIFLTIFLAISFYFLRSAPWESTSLFHTVIETTAFMLAVIVGILALIRYYSKKNLTFLFIGTGFLGTGVLNMYHTIVTSSTVSALVPSGLQEIFIWSWTAERNFLGLFLFFSWLFWKKESWFISKKRETKVETIIYVSAPIFMIVVFLACFLIRLPSPYFYTFFGIRRPGDAVAGLFFLMALIGYLSKGGWKRDDVENWLIVSIIFAIFVQICMTYSHHIHDMYFNLAHIFKDLSYIAVLIGLLISMYYLFKETESLYLNLAQAKGELEHYSENLEGLILERTNDLNLKNQELESAVHELTTTQSRLVSQEKLASLGALTAGIAHEIKNPLNFVNNFSILAQRNATNIEKIVDKYKEAYQEQDLTTATKLFNTLRENLSTVADQGARADTIIKRMLEHARSQDEVAVSTDINNLLEEYITLAYHGMRAQDASFTAKIETDLDQSVGKLNLIASDMSRVFLNLLNNAFYSVHQKAKQLGSSYSPTIRVTTKVEGEDNLVLRFYDNGVGIPDYLLPKVFLPFFTTRPVGQGTGLGLSISHDIIREHQGTMSVETKEGQFAEFIIRLSLKKLRKD